MYKRPKRTDSESDLIEMQNEFYANQTKNQDFQPAAKLVKKTENNEKEKPPKISKFAKQRGLSKQKDEMKVQSEFKVLLGDIIEKTATGSRHLSSDEFITVNNNNTGFPNVELATDNIGDSSGLSIFAQQMKLKRKLNPTATTSKMNNVQSDMEEVQMETEINDGIPSDIHEENLQTLSQMTKEQILEEQKNLLSSMDPQLIEYLKSRKKNQAAENVRPKTKSTSRAPIIIPAQSIQAIREIKELDILNNEASKNWVNFNVIESEKLEWMKDTPIDVPKIKPGEVFEARFDWNGILLPYIDENSTTDQRELYMHGDDIHRPGYTLQELFRLARSKVLQQRISALGSIAGILNLYNQGFYDNVLDLPITKIFFLLRFAFDDNIPAILEVTSKAFAYLFYNECDERLLDIFFDNDIGFKQPFIDNSVTSSINYDLEDELSQLNMNDTPTKSTKFGTNIPDDPEFTNKETLNDFHLAETDLIACLLRTNILERIRYILSVIRPENSTVISCIKILIRLARSSKEVTYQMITTENLISTLFRYFLPKLNGKLQTNNNTSTTCYNKPQYLVIKLFRLIASQDTDNLIKLTEFGLLDIIRNYIHCRDDICETLILLQTEAFRFIHVYVKITSDDDFLSELLSAFRYLLEWHFNFLTFDKKGSTLLRQHATALISTLGAVHLKSTYDLFYTILITCQTKWLELCKIDGVQELTQSVLLSTCLRTSQHLLMKQKTKNFESLLNVWSTSVPTIILKKLIDDLTESSILLSSYSDRSHVHKPLQNLGSIIYLNEQSGPTLILTRNNSVILLNSYLEVLMSSSNDTLELSLFHDSLLNYLNKISIKINMNIGQNWFSRFELKFLTNILLLIVKNKQIISSNLLLRTSFQLLNCLSKEFLIDALNLLENIIFNRNSYENWLSTERIQTDDDFITECKAYYYRAYGITERTPKIWLEDINWREKFLPQNWPFLPLFGLYKKIQNPNENHQSLTAASNERIGEEEIITVCTKYSMLLEMNTIDLLSSTEKLVYLMFAFFGNENKFLETDVRNLLTARKNLLSKEFSGLILDLDSKLMDGTISFENIYILFLEQFQGTSYGDATFSSLLMLPLGQKYQSKWRKIVWSEHIAALRFINCSIDDLFTSYNEYCCPIEKDLSLLKCYKTALHSRLLREKSIPYEIAKFHVNEFLTSRTAAVILGQQSAVNKSE